MARSPRQGPEIAWADFAQLLDYLQKNERDAKMTFTSESHQHQKENTAFDLIDFIAQTWKERGTADGFQLPLEGFRKYANPSTIRKLTTYANRYLRIASDQVRLMPSSIPCLTTGADTMRLIWVDKPENFTPEDRERRFDRVYYLYREWRSTHQDDMFRGFSVMAEELGIEPVLRRFQSKEDIAAEVLRIVQHHHAQDRLSQPISIVIAHESETFVNDAEDIDKAKRLAGGKLFLTRTEFANAQVHQNNKQIGALIASCMIRDLAPALKKKPSRNKVLLINADLGPLSTFQDRKKQFRWDIGASGCGLKFVEPSIAISYEDFYSSGVAEKVRDATLSVLKKDKNKEIAAIYAGYFTLTWGVIAAVKKTGRTPADLSVYSEEIVYGLIRELGNPASCLKATCGVDPFHYGRYVLRVAATRSKEDEKDRAIPPEPFVLTKDDVTYDDTSKIGYLHEIRPSRLSFHRGNGQPIDIRLEDERFAWKPWMRKELPNAYGPDLWRVRRSQPTY